MGTRQGIPHCVLKPSDSWRLHRARLGGGGLATLAPGTGDERQSAELAVRVGARLIESYAVGGIALTIEASAGCAGRAAASRGSAGLDDLMVPTDEDPYRARRAGADATDRNPGT